MILIACPTYSQKNYALERYLEAFKNFTYPESDKFLYMVDNSENDYINTLKAKGIECDHVDKQHGSFELTFNLCWRKIIDKAIEKGCEYIFSCEADNINPPETISVLLGAAKKYNAVVVAHDYPYKDNDYCTALGCTLIKTDYIKDFVPDKETAFEAHIYNMARQKNLPFVELSGILKTKHLWRVA